MKKIREIVTLFAKNTEFEKITDNCHLTGRYRGPAFRKCNNNVTQKQSSFIPFAFHNFSTYDSHLFSKKLVDKK